MKNVKVDKVKGMINYILADSSLSQETKKEFCIFLETILHETKNYNGYNFLEWINGGYKKWVEDNRPKDNGKYVGKEYDRIYY
jgi:hypothetical protein